MNNPVMKVYRAYDEMFVNSKALVIEYHDVLRAQWFATLQCIASTDAIDNFFDTSFLKTMGVDELFEWYVMREHQNFLLDLPCKTPFASKEEKEEVLDKFLFDIGQIPQLYARKVELNFHDVLTNLLADGKGMVKHIYIYGGKIKDPLLEAQFRQEYTQDVDFLYGDLGKSLEGINKDATYVFSDVTKISELVEANRIECASVLVADGFRYNFLEDEDDGLRIDDEMILENYTCRISFFNNLMVSEMVDDEGNKLDPITGRILEANRH